MVGVALMAGAVCAETAAPAAMKPKKPAPSSTIVVVVTNSRDVALTELDATPTGTFIPKAIARNVAPGKKASANLATDKDCVFDLHGILCRWLEDRIDRRRFVQGQERQSRQLK